MSAKCVVCSKTVRRNQQAIPCHECDQLTHRTCDTDTSADVNRRSAITFKCVRCSTPGPEDQFLGDITFNISMATDDDPEDCPTDDRIPDLSDINISHASLPADLDVHESSMTETSVLIDPPIADTPERSYTLVEEGSQKGKRKLIDSFGFSYVHRKTAGQKTYWRCSVRSKKETCPASVIQTSDTYTEGKHRHCHPPEPGKLTAVTVRVEVKKNALESIFTAGSQIVEDAQRKLVDPDQPGGTQNPATLTRMANRTREQLRPKDPHDLTFELVKDFLPEDFLQADIVHRDQRHIILATDRQLCILSKSRQWFLDGTFKIVKEPFHQLLSIHAFVRSGSDMKMLPLVFVIMSRRRTPDYVSVFRSLLDLLPSQPEVRTMVMDFELATWKAAARVLPEVRLRGCLFHHTQAVFRKIQEIGLGTAYRKDQAFNKFGKKLMALPFLPAGDIAKVFEQIEAKVTPDTNIARLVRYFRRQWIDHAVFTPRTWSVFNITVRTNNHVEGWHRRINTRVSEQSLGFYRLLSALYDEASLLPIQTRMIKEGQLRSHVRQQFNRRQEEIFALWRLYGRREISASELLTRAARQHAPAE